jgi:hypothetical protein
MAGLLGPGADAESLVLSLINRQGRYLARRTCHARRRELGARTTTLVLSEDKAGEAVLASVDLASSFPALCTLVQRCMKDAWEGWPERFCAFVSRNAAALQQLRHLDLGYASTTATPLTSSALAALARLPGLQSLPGSMDEELSPPCWAALCSLKQLTGLRLDLSVSAAHPQHLQHIVDAAPQLRELWMWLSSSPKQLACLTGLRSLGSLELWVIAGAAPALRSLTALQGLTHLALESDGQLGGLMAAVGQSTGLVLLELRCRSGGPLQPLAALQQLTSLALRDFNIDEQEAQVLAGLGQLRRLVAYFDSRVVAAAAGLARLEECEVWLRKFCTEGEPQGGVPVKAPGHLCTSCACLASFDLSSVHTLKLTYHNTYAWGSRVAGALGQQLSRCPQLRALRLNNVPVRPEALQVIATMPQLQHLCLRAFQIISPQPDFNRLAVLAGSSRQLRQLTLGGSCMADLAESTLVALMVGLPSCSCCACWAAALP